MLFTDFNVGNGPAEDVEADHDLEFNLLSSKKINLIWIFLSR